jgi:hypothetical protein
MGIHDCAYPMDIESERMKKAAKIDILKFDIDPSLPSKNIVSQHSFIVKLEL